MMKYLLMSATALVLVSCAGEDVDEDVSTPPAESEIAAPEEAVATPNSAEQLDVVLAAQSDVEKARYQYRHPKEMLLYYGVEPGMTVVDTLPGEVWYSGILSAYLGEEGKVIGADYSNAMWPFFGGFADEAFLKEKETWTESWVADMEAIRRDGGASFDAFVYGALPEEMYGTADVVLVVRAMHHLSRFEEEGGFLTAALIDIKNVLKPGGIVGVVQHRAPETSSDEWAEGDNGYVKQSRILTFFEVAGFEYLESSELNANPKDQPTEEEFVWRLPPSFATSRDNPELKAQMEAIGESDRMMLKFRKPE